MHPALSFSLLALYLYLAAVATYHIFSCGSYDARQQFWQLLLAWLLPCIGATVVTAVALSDRDRIGTQPEAKGLPSRLMQIITLSAFAGGGIGDAMQTGHADPGSHDAGTGFDGGVGDGGG